VRSHLVARTPSVARSAPNMAWQQTADLGDLVVCAKFGLHRFGGFGSGDRQRAKSTFRPS
jgi:hypothetical protein